MKNSFFEIKKLSFLLLTAIIISGITKDVIAKGDLTIGGFIGTWHGNGQLFGMKADFKITFEWVLKKQFMQLTFLNNLKDKEGHEQELNSLAFYKLIGEDLLQGYWFDSRGTILPLNANMKDSVLTTLWGGPNTEKGKTIYSLVGIDRLDVTDYILKNEQWKEFGHAVYYRVK